MIGSKYLETKIGHFNIGLIMTEALFYLNLVNTVIGAYKIYWNRDKSSKEKEMYIQSPQKYLNHFFT